MLSAGLGLWLPEGRPLIGSVSVGGSIEQMRMDVDVVPSEVANVMREPLDHISERCRPVDDSIGYKTLHDAVIVAENICASLLRYVEPENLFFIFGQTIQSIGYAPIRLPLTPPLFAESEYIGGNGYCEQRDSNNEDQTKNRAVVLCKLKHSDELTKLLVGKKQEGRPGTKGNEGTWRELQEFNKRLGDFSGRHIERPNSD